MLSRFLKNYALRHQNRWNQLLHLIGLPITFVLPVVLLLEGFSGWWAFFSFLCGYALQCIGHAVEGNDAGEVILIKRMLRMPYIDIVGPVKESSEEN